MAKSGKSFQLAIWCAIVFLTLRGEAALAVARNVPAADCAAIRAALTSVAGGGYRGFQV